MLTGDAPARFGELRSVLNEPYRRGVWAAARELLYEAARDHTLPQILDYVTHHLSRWPDALRRSSDHLFMALLDNTIDEHAALWKLVRHVQLDGEFFEERMGAPVRRVHCWLRTPLFEETTHLELTRLGLHDQDVEALVGRLRPDQLHTLKLSGNAFSEEGVKAFLRAPALRALRELDLTSNRGGGYEEAIVQLVTSPTMRHLERLKLGCELTREDVMHVFSSPALGRLTHLGLQSSLISSQSYDLDAVGADVASLMDVTMRLDALRELDLGDNDLNDDELLELAGVPWLSQLTYLKLDWNVLTDRAVEALGAASVALQRLGLRGCEIGERGAHLLLASAHFSALTRLDVSSTLGLAQSEAFSAQPPRLLGLNASSRFWLDALNACERPLDMLNLSDLNLSLDAPDIERLARASSTRSLTRLDLAHCTMSCEAVQVCLNATRGFEHLEVLNLNRNDDLAEWFSTLTSQPLPPSMKVLQLRDTGLGDAHIAQMCASWAWAGLDVLDLRDNYFSPHVHELLRAFVVAQRCDVLWDPPST